MSIFVCDYTVQKLSLCFIICPSVVCVPKHGELKTNWFVAADFKNDVILWVK